MVASALSQGTDARLRSASVPAMVPMPVKKRRAEDGSGTGGGAVDDAISVPETSTGPSSSGVTVPLSGNIPVNMVGLESVPLKS